MSTGAIIGIVIVVIVVVAAVVVASGELRRARLRRQFGPEYDRLAQQLGSRKKAEAELAARQRRVEALRIHELSAEQQASYSGDWATIQERFVDTPAEAVAAANTLIWGVMRDRGYPADDKNASVEALSFHHPQALAGYRQTVDLRTDKATTEQLREAMIRYRTLFEDLTGLRDGRGEPRPDRVAEIRNRGAGTHSAVEDNRGAGTHSAVEDNRGAGTHSAVEDNRGAGTHSAVEDNRDRTAANTDRIPADNDRIPENNDLAAENRELAARNRQLAAENRDLVARNNGLSAEDTNRAADTPR